MHRECRANSSNLSVYAYPLTNQIHSCGIQESRGDEIAPKVSLKKSQQIIKPYLFRKRHEERRVWFQAFFIDLLGDGIIQNS